VTEELGTVLVTGGAGFIDSAMVRLLMAERSYSVIDRLKFPK
jgi:UDP-glucose 4-epimerase